MMHQSDLEGKFLLLQGSIFYAKPILLFPPWLNLLVLNELVQSIAFKESRVLSGKGVLGGAAKHKQPNFIRVS